MKKLTLIGLILLIPVEASALRLNLFGQMKDQVLMINATSQEKGRGAYLALDGNEATSWMPYGDPGSEGIMLVLAVQTPLESILIKAPAAQNNFTLSLYINGSYSGELRPGQAEKFNKQKVSSLYFKVQGGPAQNSAVSEILINGKTFKAPVVYDGSVSASSTLTPAESYAPAQLFDGRLDFGWAEGVKGSGKRENIQMELDKSAEIDTLYLANGYQRSAEHYQANARVKDFTLTADGKPLGKFTATDEQGFQNISLGKKISFKKLILEVLTVYKGSKYEDLVISELKFGRGQDILDVETPAALQQMEKTKSAVKNTILEKIIGRNLRFVMDHTGMKQDVTLKLRPNGSFVLWQDIENDMEYETVKGSYVMDGNWLAQKQSADRATVKIFGKNHSVMLERDYSDPYSDPDYVSRTKIFSDQLEIKKTEKADFSSTDSSVHEAILWYLDRNSAENLYTIKSKTVVGLFPAEIIGEK